MDVRKFYFLKLVNTDHIMKIFSADVQGYGGMEEEKSSGAD